MEALKITSTLFFILGLGLPKYFKNRACLLFASAALAVVSFYIGLGHEVLSFIVDRKIKVFSTGFVCFNLTALFTGSWISCMVCEFLMDFGR